MLFRRKNTNNQETGIPSARRVRTALFIVIIVLAVLGAYIGGYFVGRGEAPALASKDAASSGALTDRSVRPEWWSNDVTFGIYWDVWKWIQEHYIDRPVADPQLFYGSLEGLVASLGDPYSVFLEPKDAEEFTQELQGSFEGIGAEIGIRDDRLTVISPLTESPAERVGLKPMDWIVAIDDFETTGIDLDDAVQRIRGPRGTQVSLTIMREGFDAPRDFDITREEIKIVSVRYEVKDEHIGYIKITNFHADTIERFRNAVRVLLSSGIEGIIVDVRNNPGGYLNSAVEIASYWVDEGAPVVLERTADQRTREYSAVRNQVLKGYPTALLVNRGSASASEILAGALQDYGIARIVGETTFGKGSIQEVQDFSDGSAVKLTIARWLTPNERQIDKNGIAPDEEVELTEDDVKQDNDPQMEKALEILENLESGSYR